MKKILVSVALLGALSPFGAVWAAPAGSEDINNVLHATNAGAQLSQMQDYLERELVARQISEQRAKVRAEVQRKEEKSRPSSDVSFPLHQLVIADSKVLTAEELAAIKATYEGREVSLDDLCGAVDAVNGLYESHGYVTCRALLRPQKIENGVVHIDLVEGTVGRVVLEGNNHTDANYILNRLPLAEGSIPSVSQLNHDQLRFNGTNDAQLRIVLKAGEAEGTTDYYITVKEPKNSSWTVFSDNMGAKSTGEYRGGLFYNNRSLSGLRNSLTLGTVFSRGTAAFSEMYSHPVGRSGGKLNFGMNFNTVRQVKNIGIYKTTGHASSFSLGYSQPICVSETFRSEFSADLRRQNSISDLKMIPGNYKFRLVDDTVTDLSLGLAMTKYGNRSVFYQKHTMTVGRSSSDSYLKSESKNFGLYKLSMLYQKFDAKGRNFSARFDGQYSFKKELVSAREFYIGGMYSVRGYDENYLSGVSGIAMSLEYGVPLTENRKLRAFGFFDYGRVFTENRVSESKDGYLVSTGLGLRAQMGDYVSGTVSIGFPLKRDFSSKADHVSSNRVNFTLSAQF